MRHKQSGVPGKVEASSWTEKDSLTTSDLAAAENEAADAAAKEAWSHVPDVKPSARPGVEHDAKFLKFLTHHKLVGQDATLETLQALVDHDHEKRAQLLAELEALPSCEKEKETYADLHRYILVASSEIARLKSTDGAGNTIEAPPKAKKAASRADLKRIKRLVELKREGGIDANTDDELAAQGLYIDAAAA